jgi:NCS1 family nucleobase:cation symporter-1
MGCSVLVAALGYRYIHFVGTLGTVVCGVLLVGAAGILLFGDRLDAAAFTSTAGFTWSGFLAMVAIGAVWLIAFAPYVSDYSRYMPKTAAGIQSTFWSTYAGGVTGACLPMLIGVSVALAVEGDTLVGIPTVLGSGYGNLLLLAFAIITVHANAMNLYGGALTLLTSVQTFKANWRPVAAARTGVAALMAIVAAAIALGASDDFNTNFINFVLLLTVTLVPWSVINLLDYYVIHRGQYDLRSLMSRGGGIYGLWRRPALVSYAIGILVQIPFISSALYVGPVAERIHGIDISWVVSSLVTAPVYLFLARRDALSKVINR